MNINEISSILTTSNNAAQLTALAKKLSIDLGGAKTVKDIKLTINNALESKGDPIQNDSVSKQNSLQQPIPDDKTDEQEYITSPDGKYRFPRPKGIHHSDILDGGQQRLPDLKSEGFKCVWIHDRNPNTIYNMIKKGYEFCPQSVLDAAGIRKGHQIASELPKEDGNMSMYYAMQIPLDRWAEIERLRKEHNRKKNEDLVKKYEDSENDGASDKESSKIHYQGQVVRS